MSFIRYRSDSMTGPLLSAEEVTRGSDSISDKIRALYKAGYDRSQISHFLNIRYQHVRNVLLQSGLVGGLQGEVLAEREPLPVEPDAMLPEPVPRNVLLGSGFRQLGAWRLELDGKLGIDARAPDEPGVYVFVADEEVVLCGRHSERVAGPPGRVHPGI
jgi:hypothetical protein